MGYPIFTRDRHFKIMRIKDRNLLNINVQPTSGLFFYAANADHEHCSRLLLLMSYGHSSIPKGFQNNSHGCKPWKISDIQ